MFIVKKKTINWYMKIKYFCTDCLKFETQEQNFNPSLRQVPPLKVRNFFRMWCNPAIVNYFYHILSILLLLSFSWIEAHFSVGKESSMIGSQNQISVKYTKWADFKQKTNNVLVFNKNGTSVSRSWTKTSHKNTTSTSIYHCQRTLQRHCSP